MRPEGTIEGLRWDYNMGQSYTEGLGKEFFAHFMAAIALERETMRLRLENSEEEGGQLREAIKLANRLLKLPDKMVRDGRESGKELARIGRS